MTTIVRAGSEHLALVHPLFCDYRAFYKLERKEGAARKFLAARLERQDSAILLALDDSLVLDVLPASGRLAVEVDGIVRAFVTPGDRLPVTPSRDAARVVRLGNTTFYERARRKLRVYGSAEVE